MKTIDDNKGQLHTLEGFTAAFMILLAMFFAFQSVSITPTSSSTASQEVETQNYVLADDVLAALAENGTLKEAILKWDADGREFEGSPSGDHNDARYYLGTSPPEPLGDILQETLLDRGIAYNIDLACDRTDDNSRVREFVDFGEPSKHAVTATQRVILYEDDELREEDGSLKDERLVDEDGSPQYFCENVSEDSDLYNVVEVRITAWRM